MEIDREEVLRASLNLRIWSAKNTLKLLFSLRRILRGKGDTVLTQSDRRDVNGCLKAVKSMVPKDLHHECGSFTVAPDETADAACSRVRGAAVIVYKWYHRVRTAARSYNPL